MNYLDLPNLEEFVKELQANKIKSCRIHSYYRTENQNFQGSVIQLTSFLIKLTALNGQEIVRMEEFIGREMTVSEEKMKELAQLSLKRASDISTLLSKKKISTKSGVYRFPKED